MPSPELSIVIPNIEEESLFKMIGRLRTMFGKGLEIIIVDKSGEAYYRRLKATGVTILRQKDRGVENALMLGFRSARGRILMSIDADDTHELEGLTEAVRLVKSGKADLVMGNRLAGLQEGSMSPYLKFGNAAISGIFSMLYGARMHDILTGLFVMTRQAFNDMRDVAAYRAGSGMFAIELAKRGYDVREIGIEYYERGHGVSKLAKSKLGYGVNIGLLMLKKRFGS